MGHYASEMGNEYTGPTAEEIRDEKLAELQKDWDWYKTLFSQNFIPSGSGGSRSCPRCMAKINYWFIAQHDDWHATLNQALRTVPMFGGIGMREV